MATITISREYGSGGEQIGREAAKQLGYDFIDQRILEGVFRQYGLTKFGDLYTSEPGFFDLLDGTNLLIVSILNEAMEAIAHRGNMVILGRGGFASLSDYADVLKVRIQAPKADRIRKIMEREKVSHAEAEQKIRKDDQTRHKFVQMFYNKQWDIETHFNLVVDTSTVSTEMAVNWIVEATQALESKSFGEQVLTAQKAKVDPVLLDAIEKSLQNPLPELPQ